MTITAAGTGATNGLATATNAAATAAATSATGTGGTSSSATPNALQQLAGNYNDFLNMLMTQLKNQDPTSPMDSSQFTTELVQFTGVQQQVQTNTNLSQMIALTQSSDITQSSSMVGHKVQVQASQIALQNGTGGIAFTTAAAEPVTIQITDAKGNTIDAATIMSKAGSNSWTWNGANSSGGTEPDGAYNIAVTTSDGSGKGTAVPFNVTGTATGVTKGTGTSGVNLDLGALAVDMGAVQSVSAASGGG